MVFVALSSGLVTATALVAGAAAGAGAAGGAGTFAVAGAFVVADPVTLTGVFVATAASGVSSVLVAVMRFVVDRVFVDSEAGAASNAVAGAAAFVVAVSSALDVNGWQTPATAINKLTTVIL